VRRSGSRRNGDRRSEQIAPEALAIIRKSLRQMPTNLGAGGLSFARKGSNIFPIYLEPIRGPACFLPLIRRAAVAALGDAAHTIDQMPSTFITYLTRGRIRASASKRPNRHCTQPAYLTSFGLVCAPSHLWRAMRRIQLGRANTNCRLDETDSATTPKGGGIW